MCKFEGCEFEKSSFTKAHFQSSTIFRCTFKNSVFKSTIITGTGVTANKFTNCYLKDTQFTYSNMSENRTGNQYNEVEFKECLFHSYVEKYSSFESVQFNDCRFIGHVVSNSIVNDSVFNSCNFATFRGQATRYQRTKFIDIYSSNDVLFNSAIITSCEFTNFDAKFSLVNLTSAKITKTTLTNFGAETLDLTDSTVEETVLKSCEIEETNAEGINIIGNRDWLNSSDTGGKIQLGESKFSSFLNDISNDDLLNVQN